MSLTIGKWPGVCGYHLLIAPLWVAYDVNLGTLLRTCDALGACMAVPNRPHYRRALARGDTLARPLSRLHPTQERTIVPLGHEGHGIPPDVLDCADTCVELPMRGVGQSLNVAVAGSLVAYRLAGLA
ncbi:hypothetical protein OJ998_23670 [Solirubrobacter taibaiensis]|nr:hypothetical protein [Solirubrobacter taibaiensis]